MCQREKDVVRKEGGGREGGRIVFTGFSESDINKCRMRKILILKLTLQSWFKPSETWDVGQGQGRGWESAAGKPSGCPKAAGFMTHQVTHSLGRGPLHFLHLHHSSVPSPHLLHTSSLSSPLTRTMANSSQK